MEEPDQRGVELRDDAPPDAADRGGAGLVLVQLPGQLVQVLRVDVVGLADEHQLAHQQRQATAVKGGAAEDVRRRPPVANLRKRGETNYSFSVGWSN